MGLQVFKELKLIFEIESGREWVYSNKPMNGQGFKQWRACSDLSILLFQSLERGADILDTLGRIRNGNGTLNK